MIEIARASRALKDATGCDKLNVAAIGNVVPQLHVHVVARRRSDPLWPKPVWGAAPPRPYDTKAAMERFVDAIRAQAVPDLDRFPIARSRRLHAHSIWRARAMTFRIAVVQPISHRPGEDERNVADAVASIERAAAEGAHFVCFPETYPGPWRMPATFDPTAAMAEAAAKHGVHVVFGTIEPIDAQGRHRLQPHLHGLSRRPRAGALPPHASERPVDLHRRHRLGVPIRAGRRVPGVRHRARQGRARDVQRGLHAGGLARARAARRRADLHAGRQGQAAICGRRGAR